MSTFAADRSSMLDKLSNYTAVMRQRKDALIAIQSISAELLDVLAAGDYESLNDILNKRDRAFKLLTQTASGSSDLKAVIEYIRRSPAEGSEQSAAALCAMDQDVQAILADVVEKQKRCEDQGQAPHSTWHAAARRGPRTTSHHSG